MLTFFGSLSFWGEVLRKKLLCHHLHVQDNFLIISTYDQKYFRNHFESINRRKLHNSVSCLPPNCIYVPYNSVFWLTKIEMNRSITPILTVNMARLFSIWTISPCGTEHLLCCILKKKKNSYCQETYYLKLLEVF